MFTSAGAHFLSGQNLINGPTVPPWNIGNIFCDINKLPMSIKSTDADFIYEFIQLFYIFCEHMIYRDRKNYPSLTP